MRERILILVKTYPIISEKYLELVCTAGVNKNGEWRRLYPIPFNRLEEVERYKKYQWIEVDIRQSESDRRPESHRLNSAIEVLPSPVATKDKWAERKHYLFEDLGLQIWDDLTKLIAAANENALSLAVFKPSEISGVKIEPTEKEWDKKKLAAVMQAARQGVLFSDLEREINIVKKLPYKFSYEFKDCNGKSSTLMIEDWEIGALYWKCLKRTNGDSELAAEMVKGKYEGFINKCDLLLFLGTTLKFHQRAPNPFVIIGVFYPPKEIRQPLL